jgi:hypothetical protein
MQSARTGFHRPQWGRGLAWNRSDYKRIRFGKVVAEPCSHRRVPNPTERTDLRWLLWLPNIEICILPTGTRNTKLFQREERSRGTSRKLRRPRAAGHRITAHVCSETHCCMLRSMLRPQARLQTHDAVTSLSFPPHPLRSHELMCTTRLAPPGPLTALRARARAPVPCACPPCPRSHAHPP